MTYKVQVKYWTGKSYSSWIDIGEQYITIKGARKELYKSLITARYVGRIINNKNNKVVGEGSWAIAHKTIYRVPGKTPYQLYKDGSIVKWYR